MESWGILLRWIIGLLLTHRTKSKRFRQFFIITRKTYLRRILKVTRFLLGLTTQQLDGFHLFLFKSLIILRNRFTNQLHRLRLSRNCLLKTKRKMLTVHKDSWSRSYDMIYLSLLNSSYSLDGAYHARKRFGLFALKSWWVDFDALHVFFVSLYSLWSQGSDWHLFVSWGLDGCWMYLLKDG